MNRIDEENSLAALYKECHHKLITFKQFNKLLERGKATIQSGGDNLKHKPIVKLFTPDGNCTWLLSELDPENPLVAFGLCDLGVGFPEMGLSLIHI